MFASLPFILLLILQGFARQDCAELLFGGQDLVNIPSQTRSLKAFDDLFVQFSLVGKEYKKGGIQSVCQIADDRQEFSLIDDEGNRNLERGFLELQRSRDGPVA